MPQADASTSRVAPEIPAQTIFSTDLIDRDLVADAIERLIEILDAYDDPDREFDPAEFGLADLDGLAEQFGRLT